MTIHHETTSDDHVQHLALPGVAVWTPTCRHRRRLTGQDNLERIRRCPLQEHQGATVSAPRHGPAPRSAIRSSIATATCSSCSRRSSPTYGSPSGPPVRGVPPARPDRPARRPASWRFGHAGVADSTRGVVGIAERRPHPGDEHAPRAAVRAHGRARTGLRRFLHHQRPVRMLRRRRRAAARNLSRLQRFLRRCVRAVRRSDGGSRDHSDAHTRRSHRRAGTLPGHRPQGGRLPRRGAAPDRLAGARRAAGFGPGSPTGGTPMGSTARSTTTPCGLGLASWVSPSPFMAPWPPVREWSRHRPTSCSTTSACSPISCGQCANR